MTAADHEMQRERVAEQQSLFAGGADRELPGGRNSDGEGVDAPLFDPAVLVEFAHTRMPFGRYAGRRLVHLPQAYLVWFSQQGFPEGKLGRQLALALEIKHNGLESLITPLYRGR